MINKLKIGLASASLLTLLGAGTALAAAGDLTWSADQTIDLSSPNFDFTVKSGSTASTFVVGTGSVDVTVLSGDTFTISSSSSDLLIDVLSEVSMSCSGGAVSQIVLAPTTSRTYHITASGTPCVPAGSGSGGGGGGSVTSYVAQSPVPVVVQVTPNTTMVTQDPGCSGTNPYNTSTGAVCVNNMTTTSGTNGAATYNLGTAILKNGSHGEAVKALQKVLNKILNQNLVIDGKLGPKTIATIKAWQKAHGLKADGLVGPATKAKMLSEAAK